MGGDQAWIMDVIPLLDSALNAKGIGPNRFALVGFGGGREGVVVGTLPQPSRSDPIHIVRARWNEVSGSALDDIYRSELLQAGLPRTGQYVLVVEPESGADVADDVSFGFTPTIDETFRNALIS